MAKIIFFMFNPVADIEMRFKASSILAKGHEVLLVALHESVIQRIDASSPAYYSEDVPLTFSVEQIGKIAQQLSVHIESFAPDALWITSCSCFSSSVFALLPQVRLAHPCLRFICSGSGPTCDPEAYKSIADLILIGECPEVEIGVADLIDTGSIALGQSLVLHVGENVLGASCAETDLRMRVPLLDEHVAFISDDGLKHGYVHYATTMSVSGVVQCPYCRQEHQNAEYVHGAALFPRAADALISELITAKQFGAGSITILDAHLHHDNEYLAAFFQLYEIYVNIPLYIQFDIASVLDNVDIVCAAFSAGLKWVTLNVMSGSENFARTFYKKRTYTNSMILDVLQLLRSHRVENISCRFIIGHPFESELFFSDSMYFVKHAVQEYECRMQCIFFSWASGTSFILKHPKYAMERRCSQNVLWKKHMLLLRGVADDELFERMMDSSFFKKYPRYIAYVNSDCKNKKQNGRPRAWYRRITASNVRLAAYKRIAVWGTGGRCEHMLIPYMRDKGLFECIIMFVDGNPQKANQIFYGKKICSPYELKSAQVEVIIIASTFVDEIVMEIGKLELKAECIFIDFDNI